MEWAEDLSVGIPEIDAQHQTLINCITALEHALERQERWLAIHFALVQLSDYVRIHFAVEESLMRIHGYDGLEKHAEEHRQFVAVLASLKERSLTTDTSEQMITFLSEWLENHIRITDKEFFAGLAKEGRPA